MARSKGTSLLNNRAFIEHRFGGAGWERLLAAVSDEDRDVLQTAVAVGWYDLGVELRMLRAIDRVLLDGKPDLLDEMGRWIADRDLNGVQRLFLRLASPAYVLEKGTSYWNRFYDSGHWDIERVPHGADARLVDFALPDVLFCRGNAAYLGRMFELVGAKDVSMLHPRCRGRGESECLFQGRWR